MSFREAFSLFMICILVATVVAATTNARASAEPLETRTFPVGASVIPMDNHQNDRFKAFGFVHALLREGVTIFRIIQPPDVILKTIEIPLGDVYSGGPILVEEPIPATVRNQFPTVTVLKLAEEFTSNRVFRSNRPTEILVIYGIWGHTEIVLDWMGIPYTMKTRGEVEANPSMLADYNLVVVDCPGWGGTPPTEVANAIEAFTANGGEIIFTDIALKDLALIFPGYVSVVGNIDGTWNFNLHNVGEFPSQYYGPSTLPIYTMGGGIIADEILNPDVRVILDIENYGGAYRIGAFYFPYGNGIVEGFAYHPPEQTGESGILSASLYGNKFIHILPPPVISVHVDIKPGSWPNPINIDSKGVFAVAICGTEDFDVRTINPTTVKIYIEGIEEGVSPKRWSYEDVATPYNGEPGGGHALSGDGYMDLVLHFDTKTAVLTMHLYEHVGKIIPLIIKGNLYEEFNGKQITGQDYVWILKSQGRSSSKDMPNQTVNPTLRGAVKSFYNCKDTLDFVYIALAF